MPRYETLLRLFHRRLCFISIERLSTTRALPICRCACVPVSKKPISSTCFLSMIFLCVDDDEFSLLAADVVTQAAHCPASSSEGALPSTLRLGTTITEGLHGSPLGSASSLSLSNNDAAHLTGDDQDGDSSIDGAVDTAASSHAATRQADVRVRPQSCPVSTGSWPPLHAHGSRAWRRKGALVWRYHSIWHHSKEHMEQHLAAAGAVTYGLEHGDSR